MLLSCRILIGEMSFSPMRQLSLVTIMVLPRVSYWWPPIRWPLRGKTSQVGSRECWVLGVDFIRLGRNVERIHGRFTVDTYEQILTNVVIPSASELYPEGILHVQQDNQPVHTANQIQEWFNRRPDIYLLEWPPNSPDMNPIENGWARVERILRSNWAEPPVRTSDELWNRVLTWQEVAAYVNLFHNLVDSMPRRMRAIVNAGDLWTKY